MNDELIDLVLERDEIADLDPAERRLVLRSLVHQRCGGRDAGSLINALADSIDGYGLLSEVMNDDAVTDVLINGPHDVWVERGGRLTKTSISWRDTISLVAYAERLLAAAGGRADAARPVADAMLPDGTRLHVVLPPIAPSGPLVSIRKWPRTRFSLDDLGRKSMFASGMAEALLSAVQNRRTLLISGATATGKTTLLNALLGEVPAEERVVVVEEARELVPACVHWVSLLTRSPNLEGTGSVDSLELVRAALRMRPDRIVIGEVRGGEAMAALGALSTGHAGSMLTVHATSARDALGRLVSLALQARSGDSEAVLTRTTERAIDAVVHLDRCAGTRRVVEILEVK